MSKSWAEGTMRPECPACGGYLLPCSATDTGIHPGLEPGSVALFERDTIASVRDLAQAIENRSGKLDFIQLWNTLQHVGKAWEEVTRDG